MTTITRIIMVYTDTSVLEDQRHSAVFITMQATNISHDVVRKLLALCVKLSAYHRPNELVSDVSVCTFMYNAMTISTGLGAISTSETRTDHSSPPDPPAPIKHEFGGQHVPTPITPRLFLPRCHHEVVLADTHHGVPSNVLCALLV